MDAPLPPFTFSLASLQLPAPPTTFLFSVLRASALLLRAPPLPSGQVPLPSGRGGPGTGCCWPAPACRCPSGGGRGAGGLLHPRTPAGLALRSLRSPFSTLTRWPLPSCLAIVRPRCSLRALPLVAADGQAAALGRGSTPGRPHSAPSEGWGDLGGGVPVADHTALPPLPEPEPEPSQLLCLLPLCRGHCHLPIRTPGSWGSGSSGVSSLGPWKGGLREAGTVPWGPVRLLHQSEGWELGAVPWPVAPVHRTHGGASQALWWSEHSVCPCPRGSAVMACDGSQGGWCPLWFPPRGPQTTEERGALGLGPGCPSRAFMPPGLHARDGPDAWGERASAARVSPSPGWAPPAAR